MESQNIYRENRYIWCVTAESESDGHRVPMAYFSKKEYADKHIKDNRYTEPQVIQTTLFEKDGEFYKISFMSKILVDQSIIKREALNKLSHQEKLALGLIK